MLNPQIANMLSSQIGSYDEAIEIYLHHITKIYVDGANPEVIRELKSRIGEYYDYYGRLTEEQIWALRSSNSWQIIPVNFQKTSRDVAVDICSSLVYLH